MLVEPFMANHHMIMARGLLRPWLMLMLTMVDMAMEDMPMALLMAMDTGVVIIMARGQLTLRLKLTMVDMVMEDIHMVSQEGNTHVSGPAPHGYGYGR